MDYLKHVMVSLEPLLVGILIVSIFTGFIGCAMRHYAKLSNGAVYWNRDHQYNSDYEAYAAYHMDELECKFIDSIDWAERKVTLASGEKLKRCMRLRGWEEKFRTR